MIVGGALGYFLNVAGLFTTRDALMALIAGVVLLLIVHVIRRPVSHR
jgi:uncharacterized membrane protein